MNSVMICLEFFFFCLHVTIFNFVFHLSEQMYVSLSVCVSCAFNLVLFFGCCCLFVLAYSGLFVHFRCLFFFLMREREKGRMQILDGQEIERIWEELGDQKL